MKKSKIKAMHEGLTNAFHYAFMKLQKEGGSVKDIHWFKSEREKDLISVEKKQESM